ncbi:MAG TPA: hypothetical protein VNQ79_13865 [Blastocatellia bacterium]|nr:hypothetical protein [Blastocatellia bacterium]
MQNNSPKVLTPRRSMFLLRMTVILLLVGGLSLAAVRSDRLSAMAARLLSFNSTKGSPVKTSKAAKPGRAAKAKPAAVPLSADRTADSAAALTATVKTDKTDYAPGATAVITGAGFGAVEIVTLQVTHTDGTAEGGAGHDPWTVNTDASGNFTTSWYVSPDDSAGSVFLLTAKGGTSGLTAQTTFTDANPSADLDQFANKDNDWVNGNLGASKAAYLEGDSIPYRLRFDNLSLASHTVIIEWDTTKGSKHALDYLTTFNRSVPSADPCDGVTGCNPISFTTFPIPADSQVTGAMVTPIPGDFRLYGGTITGVGAYSYPDGTGFTGDKSARISITFTASVANPVLAWGGHISTRADWGVNNSAIAIPGSPYHTRLIDLDGAGGNQDRSLSADAVFFPATLTIIKQTEPLDAIYKLFLFTTIGANLSNFSLDTDPGTATPDTKTFNLNDSTTRTVTETDPGPEFTLTGLTCTQVPDPLLGQNGTGTVITDTTNRKVTVTPAEGESITCTYTNTENFDVTRGKIKVVKVTIPASDPQSFTFQASYKSSTFSLKDGEMDTSQALKPGSNYSVSETVPAGWKQVSATCDNGTPGAIIVESKKTTTCTFTNEKAPTLSVTKTPDKTDVCSNANTSVTYTYVVTNTGGVNLNNVNLSDDKLGDIDGGAGISLAAGASQTFTKSATVNATTTNTVTATGTSAGGQTATATASATVTARTCGISLTKTPDKTDVCTDSNTQVTYTYVVTNTGDFFSASGSVTDDKLGSVGSFGPLAPGASATLTKAGAVNGTTTNTATASGTSGGANVSATATATVTGRTCSISLTKTPSQTDVCSGTNTSVTYTYVVKNTGDFFSASGTLTDDTLGSIGSWGPLAPGASATLTASGTVSSTTTNTATASGTSGGANVSATASATVTGHTCSISLTKTPGATAVCNGTSVTYTYIVTNTGNLFDASGSVSDDQLGAIGSFGPLAPGASATFTKAAVINGTVINTATASGSSGGASVSATASATVNGSVCRIIVKKVTDPTGDPAQFTFGGDLSGSIGDGGMLMKDILLPGTYTTSETVPAGWDLTSITCSDPTNDSSGSGTTATYKVALGETVTCTFKNTKRGMAQVIKTVGSGTPVVPSGTQSFTFEIRQGASTSAAGTTLESGTANAGNGGTINFSTKLVAGTTYNLCEVVMPGWMTTLGPPFYTVFNPGGDNSTVCTDFTVQSGQTKSFAINNIPPPGGMTRTIGFWKNWSSCSGGRQAPKLDQTLALAEPAGIAIGNLILHGSTTTPDKSPDCSKATNILNKSTLSGKKMASDPAFNLAAQLLAAKLNVQAGAGACPKVVDAINAAQALLAAINFDGMTHSAMTSAQIAQANDLASKLDAYNQDNSTFCSTP